MLSNLAILFPFFSEISGPHQKKFNDAFPLFYSQNVNHYNNQTNKNFLREF